MRRYAIAILTVATVIALGGVALAQHGGRGLTKISINGQTVSIDYGRPSLHGRNVQELLKGKLAPGNGFWRLGANSSTTFTTDTDLKFGDVTVPKGVYSLFAQRKSDSSWNLVFNKQHGQWGLKHDASLDFAFVPLHESKVSSDAQMLVIRLEQRGSNTGEVVIHWGDMELSTHFTGA
ncbi:MAG: DUF2911 domain-containing protein [Terriglobia bacterium]